MAQQMYGSWFFQDDAFDSCIDPFQLLHGEDIWGGGTNYLTYALYLLSYKVFGYSLPISYSVNIFVFSLSLTVLFHAICKQFGLTSYPFIFQIHADDGCRLIIDGNVVIDYEGVHSFSKGITSKPIRLGTGWHKIALDYFEWGGEAGLKVEWAHAGGEFRLLQASQLLP